MTRETRKRVIRIGIAVVILAAIVYGFWPEPLSVQTEVVARGPLRVVVEEEGETRVEDRYVVSSPVSAFARRIDVEVGDLVRAGEALVQLEPPRAVILDPRTRREAAARLEAAEASLERAETLAQRAVTERERLERLAEAGAATPHTLEQAIIEERQAVAARSAARAELEAARAALQPADGTAPGQPVQDVLRSPVAGRILAVHRPSGGHVNPGEVLVEVGDTQRLEVEVDVLSQDAVRIRPGTRVLLDQWGEETPLEAVVTRVAPQGVTVVSALGVEERRVSVVADLVSPPAMWANLGTGYRVLAQFVIWEQEDVLQVPTAALFRSGEGWAVFVIADNRARFRHVTVGRQTGMAAQILSGLEAGERVIIHPPNELEDGVRVRPRE